MWIRLQKEEDGYASFVSLIKISKKCLYWFKGAHLVPIVWSPAGVGASPYVMNCNVTIDTQDVSLGCSIAKAIRESTPGGLPGVQVLALPHQGAVEIACNVESVKGNPPDHLTAGEPWPSFSIGGESYCHAPASLITARVAELAGRQGVSMKGTALVGFTPRDCRGLAEYALSQGIAEFWKEQRRIRMWKQKLKSIICDRFRLRYHGNWLLLSPQVPPLVLYVLPLHKYSLQHQ